MPNIKERLVQFFSNSSETSVKDDCLSYFRHIIARKMFYNAMLLLNHETFVSNYGFIYHLGNNKYDLHSIFGRTAGVPQENGKLPLTPSLLNVSITLKLRASVTS